MEQMHAQIATEIDIHQGHWYLYIGKELACALDGSLCWWGTKSTNSDSCISMHETTLHSDIFITTTTVKTRLQPSN